MLQHDGIKIPSHKHVVISIICILSFLFLFGIGAHYFINSNKQKHAVENVKPQVDNRVVLTATEAQLLKRKCEEKGLYPNVFFWTDMPEGANASQVICYESETMTGASYNAKDM